MGQKGVLLWRFSRPEDYRNSTYGHKGHKGHRGYKELLPSVLCVLCGFLGAVFRKKFSIEQSSSRMNLYSGCSFFAWWGSPASTTLAGKKIIANGVSSSYSFIVPAGGEFAVVGRPG